jgi:hypothetical protein
MLSNLIASGQICSGDCIRVGHDDGPAGLLFGREVEGVPAGERWAARHRSRLGWPLVAAKEKEQENVGTSNLDE